MTRIQVVIATPALADANNGNWQTARRWQALLSRRHDARIVREWPDEKARIHPAHDQVLLALHARRSAPSVAAWAEQRASRGLGVVLTGTDLYRDIVSDASARHSLALARALVVLQERAIDSVPAAHQAKARVIFQSTGTRQTLAKTHRHLRVVAVGHLRDEKDPLTLMRAAEALRGENGIFIDHLGAALDPALGDAARRTEASGAPYRWLGARAHSDALRRIQRAHLLVHMSRMEGGAHVVMEAVCSGTPVIASRIDGNVGMLGADYAGYFAPGDPQALAALLRRCRDDLTGPGEKAGSDIGLMATLASQCAARAELFSPQREQAALEQLVMDLAS